jgi:type IV secretion system protein VirD4
MVSRQETARALLTPGEVMQLPATDELVFVAGTPPVRAQKLRYFEDRTFAARVLPPPMLAANGYADCPPEREHDWRGAVSNPDARLGEIKEQVDCEAADDGLEQARHPALEIDQPVTPEAVTDDPLGLGDDEVDPATDKRTMDQARALGAARAVYAIDAGSDRPDDLQLGF